MILIIDLNLNFSSLVHIVHIVRCLFCYLAGIYASIASKILNPTPSTNSNILTHCELNSFPEQLLYKMAELRVVIYLFQTIAGCWTTITSSGCRKESSMASKSYDTCTRLITLIATIDWLAFLISFLFSMKNNNFHFVIWIRRRRRRQVSVQEQDQGDWPAHLPRSA